eukprot:2258104-Amphidinium_carterae.2
MPESAPAMTPIKTFFRPTLDASTDKLIIRSLRNMFLHVCKYLALHRIASNLYGVVCGKLLHESFQSFLSKRPPS